MLRRLWARIRDFFDVVTNVQYTSVPVWKPWRDFNPAFFNKS